MIYLYALIFLFTGIVHLVSPETFIKAIPPIFPYPYAIAIVSGLVELGFTIGLTLKRTRQKTAWCVILFLVAVFPVNIYMYVERDTLFAQFPAWALLARLPGQAVLIAWAYRYTKASSSR